MLEALRYLTGRETLSHRYERWIRMAENAQQTPGTFTMQRLPGTRINTCARTADMITVLAQKEGFKARTIAIPDLNKLRGIPAQASFKHKVSLIEEAMIFDPTICQFIDPDSGFLFAPEGFSSGYTVDNPTINHLLIRGFVNVTQDAELTNYVNTLTMNGRQGGLVKVSKIGTIQPAAISDLRREKIEFDLGLRFDTPLYDSVRRDIMQYSSD